jgi:hypothetical protein
MPVILISLMPSIIRFLGLMRVGPWVGQSHYTRKTVV